MDLKLRKFTKFVDKTFIEGGKKAKEPVLLVSVATETNRTGSFAFFPPSIKVLSTNFVNFLSFKSIY